MDFAFETKGKSIAAADYQGSAPRSAIARGSRSGVDAVLQTGRAIRQTRGRAGKAMPANVEFAVNSAVLRPRHGQGRESCKLEEG